MEETKKPLYIPVNTPDSDDFISGIGSLELSIISVITTIIIIFCSIMALMKGNILLAVVIGLFSIACTIVTVRRDIYNENFLKKSKIFFEYKKTPQKYMYVYSNIYEISLKNEEEED